MMAARLQVGAGTVTVQISDLAVSAAAGSTIITHALGSCVAVVLHDPKLKAAGMLHFMLPAAKASSDPNHPRAMFADTGVPLLFEAMYLLGSKKSHLVVKLAGGASMSTGNDVFDVGKRNLAALRRIFLKNGVLVAAEDVGGSSSRTVCIEVDSGRTVVRSSRGEKEL